MEVHNGDLIIISGQFCAVYYKSLDQPQLILRTRTHTKDFELLAMVWQAACEKAREIGWIV